MGLLLVLFWCWVVARMRVRTFSGIIPGSASFIPGWVGANSRFALLREFARKGLFYLTIIPDERLLSEENRRNSRFRREKPGILPHRRNGPRLRFPVNGAGCPRPSVLVNEQHAAADQHDAGHLWPAERLVPEEMRDHCYNRIARGDRREGDRERDFLERQDVAKSSKDIDRQADHRQRVEKLCDNRRRHIGRRFQRDLSGDAEQDCRYQAAVIKRHQASAGSRNKTGGGASAEGGSRLRRTSFITDWGFPLTVR